MRNLFVVFLLMSVGAVIAQEQSPPPPALTSEQTAAIQRFELRLENTQLKIALLQTQLQNLNQEADRYLASLSVKGFSLRKNPEGTWVYVPEEAK